MFNNFGKLFLAASVLLVSNAAAAIADEQTIQVTRTVTTDAASPSIQTVTEKRTVIQPTVIEQKTVLVPRDARLVESIPVTPTIIVPETVVRKTIVTSSPTTNVYVTKTEIPLVLQTIEARRAQLIAELNDPATAAVFSDIQMRDLRRELARIDSEVVVLRTTPVLDRSVVVAQDLDALATRVRVVTPTFTYAPIIEGSHFTIVNGQVMQLDDLAVRRIELENKILAKQAGGQISYDQAEHLRSDLNAIAVKEDVLRANGQLGFKEAHSIYRDMDEVANRLDRMSM